MKKIIAFALLLISSIGYSQIKVIETVPVERLGRLNNDYYVQKIGDEYTFFYVTQAGGGEVSESKSFTFKNIDNAYQSLYDIIAGGFLANPLYDIKLELPNSFIWLHYVGSTEKLKVSVQFMVTNKATNTTNVSGQLSKEQIDKLFQKI